MALIHPRKFIFHGIFRRDDLAVRPVQFLKCGIERGRLARTGWAGHQENAVGPLDDLDKRFVIVVEKSQGLNSDANRIRSQNTKHDALAVVSRAGTNAKIDAVVSDFHLDAPILRNSPFRNVDAGENLDPRGHRALHGFGNIVAHVAHAVDAVTHAHAVGHRLDVYVRGATPNRLADHHVDQANDRRVLGFVFHDLLQIRAGFVDADAKTHTGDALGQLIAHGVDEIVDEVFDLGQGRQGGLNLGVQSKPQHIDRVEIQRIRNHDPDAVVLLADGQDHVTPNQIVGHQVQRALGDHVLRQIHKGHVELSGQGLVHIVLAAQLQLHQGFANSLPVVGGILQRVRQAVCGHDAPVREDFAYFFLLAGHLRALAPFPGETSRDYTILPFLG